MVIIFHLNRVCFGEIPLVTDKGTFIFYGCEIIIVRQIIRSPGVYLKKKKNEYKFYEGIIITNYGCWLTFELEFNLSF
ncbi:unnamed protein product [Sphacelaria rigidula]